MISQRTLQNKWIFSNSHITGHDFLVLIWILLRNFLSTGVRRARNSKRLRAWHCVFEGWFIENSGFYPTRTHGSDLRWKQALGKPEGTIPQFNSELQTQKGWFLRGFLNQLPALVSVVLPVWRVQGGYFRLDTQSYTSN